MRNKGFDFHWKKCPSIRKNLLHVVIPSFIREAGYSPPFSREVKKTWIYESTPQFVFMA
jgi:hypothetical protein